MFVNSMFFSESHASTLAASWEIESLINLAGISSRPISSNKFCLLMFRVLLSLQDWKAKFFSLFIEGFGHFPGKIAAACDVTGSFRYRNGPSCIQDIEHMGTFQNIIIGRMD